MLLCSNLLLCSIACRQHSYVPGLVLLYDKKRLHREVLAVYMEAGDHSSLISACIQYGDAAAGAICRWHLLVSLAHTAESLYLQTNPACPSFILCVTSCCLNQLGNAQTVENLLPVITPAVLALCISFTPSLA
jgi:hypothetical protein